MAAWEPVKVELREGGEIEVWSDIEGTGGEAESVAILFTRTTFEFCGEDVAVPGASFTPALGTPVTVRANVTLGRDQAVTVAEAILRATAPLTDEELALA